jgi:pimeloyl-ACP methyl ester carboxylesterase
MATTAEEDQRDPPSDLPIPLGRRIELPGRGTTFVRELAGPAGAPTLVLLHGWMASGGTNWYRVFDAAARHFRIVAPDLRGHARGLRSWRRFTLASCADDVAATLDVLGIESAIIVGYSMGGPVAQLVWKRHPEKVDGLVLCATSHSFVPGVRERLIFTSTMAAAAGTTRVGGFVTAWPRSVLKQWIPISAPGRPTSMQLWAAAEMRRHDWRMILEAGHAIGQYNARPWIGDVDVPTAVMVTARDRALLPSQQAKLAVSIPNAVVHRIDDGHVACASPFFVDPFMDACLDVANRA